MTVTTLKNFSGHIEEYINSAIRFNDATSISTENGTAVVISEQEYRNLTETMYLNSIPKVRDELIDGLNIPFEDCEEFEL